jgi:uncharacterized membrane protein
MKPFLLSFFATIIAMVAIDSVWLRLMYQSLYVPNIGHLLGDKVSYPPAILFYVLYATALYFLVIGPGIKYENALGCIALSGVLFGIVTYGTYDLTNQATMPNWPWKVTLIDIVWGGTLTGIVTLIATWITRRFA